MGVAPASGENDRSRPYPVHPAPDHEQRRFIAVLANRSYTSHVPRLPYGSFEVPYGSFEVTFCSDSTGLPRQVQVRYRCRSAFMSPTHFGRLSNVLAALMLAEAMAGRNGSCNVYANESSHCQDSNCGACFNAGSRPGKMCKGSGSQTGYYCPAETTETGDITFACLDWTFGSSAMRVAEASFKGRTGEDVFFGVGTYGTNADPLHGLAACYRLRVEGMEKEIIAQSINTGHDVAGTQFDLQIGAGGAGAFNTCAGDERSMFPGGRDVWGCQYGGVDNRSACASLPPYPRDDGPMRSAGDTLPALCEAGWDRKARLSGAGQPAGACKYNPTLRDAARVACPEELVQFTWAQRADEPSTHRRTALHRVGGFPNEGHECEAQTPGAGAAYCLTRMMDCRKPSGAFKDNVQGQLMVPGRRLVQTCLADGYTRIDVQCGCHDCYC